MTTIVDALMIELGFDSTKLVKGQREASAAFAKTKEEARKAHKDIEVSASSAAEAIESIGRRALALFAIFAGARSIKDFTQDVIATDSALGRLAKTLNIQPQSLSAWGSAVARNGGNADEAAASFKSLSDSLNEMRTTGQSSIMPWLARLQQVSGVQIRLNKGTQQSFLDIADALAKVSKKDPALADFMGRQAGISPDMVRFLSQGSAAVREALAEGAKYAPTPEQIEAFQKLQNHVVGLQQAATALGRSIIADLAPVIDPLLLQLKSWIDQNRDWLANDISLRIKAFSDYLKTIDWNAVGQGIKEFAGGVDGAAKSVGGWHKAVTLLFELWLGSKFLSVLANVGRLRVALGLPAVASALTSGLGVAAAAVAAGAVAESTPTPDPTQTQHEDAKRRERAAGTFGWRDFVPESLGGTGRAYHKGRRRMMERGGKGAGGYANANANSVIEELRKAGYNDNAIAAVVGSMQTESSFDPRAHNSVAGGHTGAWQWDSTRWPKVEAWIRSKGGDPFDYRWQAKAWIAEHNAKPGDAIYDNAKTEAGGAILKGNPSLPEAVHGVRLSERFGAGEEGGRARHASEWLPKVKSPPPSTKASIPPVMHAARGTELPVFHSGTPPMVGWHETVKAAKEATAPIAPEIHAGLVGLRRSAAGNRTAISNDNRSTSAETHIGELHVHSQATDAHGIARDIRPALSGDTYAARANSGAK